ncbi:MAG: triose-phosphate isomerase [Deltaproteobacteria bacterium]|jgi:triosephosphate isomerase|nr:triose-phosphate isomerase [Deltaproteobacteria bacterium]
MSRLPLAVANWKMNLTPSEAAKFAAEFRTRMTALAGALGRSVEVAIAPAYPALDRLGRALAGSNIGLAAQNLHADEGGAFTGEVSRAMLEDLGCRYVLIGHSERRHLFDESDATIAAKAEQLVGSPIRPILCVGETLDERERDATLEVVGRQLGAVLDATGDGLAAHLVVAYEPVWAIGTGRTATPEIAQEIHAEIRRTLIARLGTRGHTTRILYGGSVKPSNTASLLAQPDIDGALVGGASLEPESFSTICTHCTENT